MDDAFIEIIEHRIRYRFRDKTLLSEAFTHASFAHENNIQSNEKLEFLGDSVLNFLVTERLYRKNFDDEGALTKARAKIVSMRPLAKAAEQLDILRYLRLGIGASKENLSEKSKSNLFEALIAAIYLDSGLEQCRKFIFTFLDFEQQQMHIDYKTKLQEYIQAKQKGKILRYRSEIHSNEGIFYSYAMLDDCAIGKGKGKRKKDAEQEAAKAACGYYDLFDEKPYK